MPTPMVKIIVGRERKVWILPEYILSDRVEFFKSAFQGGFRESKEKVLELPEDEPTAFACVLDHILQQWQDDECLKKLQKESHQMWCQIWVLADKLGYSKAFDDVEANYSIFVHFLPRHRQIVPPTTARYLYENTSDTCTLRKKLVRGMVDTYLEAKCCCEDFMKLWSESAASHATFLSDIMTLLKGRLMEKDGIKKRPQSSVCADCGTGLGQKP